MSPPMAGLDSSFCTPWLVLRLAVYVYSTYTPSQNLCSHEICPLRVLIASGESSRVHTLAYAIRPWAATQQS